MDAPQSKIHPSETVVKQAPPVVEVPQSQISENQPSKVAEQVPPANEVPKVQSSANVVPVDKTGEVAQKQTLGHEITVPHSKLAAMKFTGVAQANAVLKPFKPYYVKMTQGIATLVAKVGDTIVVIQVKLLDASHTMRVRIVNSMAQAWAAIEPYSNPLIDKALAFRGRIAGQTQHLYMSIRQGIVRVRGAMGQRFVDVKAKLSSIMGSLRANASAGVQGAKQLIMDFTTKLVAFVSNICEGTMKRVQVLRTVVKDQVVYITCKINERIVVLRLKASELLQCVQSTFLQMYNSASGAVIGTYGGIKTNVLCATELTRTRAIELGGNVRTKVLFATETTQAKAMEASTAVRNLAANPKTQVTTISAAGGAVALGAGGGAAGLVAGGVTGAACALPAAFFTFGLSIPVGAAIGAGAGLCVGTAAGGTAGLVTGGVAGYSSHEHKEEIEKGLGGALSKAKEYKDIAKAKAMRVIGHTGGTAFA